MLLPLRGKSPKIGQNSYIAENATIVGDVEVGPSSTVMFNAVLRGDVMPIRLGKEVNVQDHVMIHGTYQRFAASIGDRVSIGHGAVIHGAEVGSGTLIGMRAVLMDGCKIGQHCLVAAGSLITEGSEFPAGQLIVGQPARIKRSLRDDEIEKLEKSADNYLFYKSWYEE